MLILNHFKNMKDSEVAHTRHSILMSHTRNSSPPTFHPDISHPEFYGGDNLESPRMKIHGGESEMLIDV